MTSRLPAFASRNYRIFWTTQFISLIGTWMQTTVQAYLAYRITGEPIYLGLVGFANTLPALLFTLPGGVWVERLNKRKIVIALQVVMLIQAFVLAVLTLTGLVTIWWIIGLAFVLGAANAIEITARQAMLSELVAKEALPNAIALQATGFNVARVVGPALAAPLLVLFANGEGWAFMVNAISYLVVILGLWSIHPQTLMASGMSRTAKAVSGLTQFREGQSYIRRTPLIALVIVLAAVPGLLAFPVIQQVPAFARDVLSQPGDTDAAVAARNSAMVTVQGVGALVAAVMQVWLSGYPRKGRLMVIGQFAFSVAMVGIALSRSMALTLPMMTLFGWGTVMTLNNSNIVVQMVTPPELRGRVISTYLWALQGIAPFGSLLVGWLAQTLGAPVAALIAGLACLVIFIGVHIATPVVRQFVAE